MNKTLIIGMGEVGTALKSILQEVYGINIDTLDFDEHPDYLKDREYDVMNICFPYSKGFVEFVREYQERFKPKYTVIHSSVPVGTSKLLGAVHSPIRGKHPHLRKGILTFPKILGGEKASEVADYFRRAGISIILYDTSEASEAAKLWDTKQYLESIRLCQEIKEYCDQRGLNFHEVYTIPNQTYNEGYTKLGMPEVMRPVLQPIKGKIGGHCLLPNEELLQGG